MTDAASQQTPSPAGPKTAARRGLLRRLLAASGSLIVRAYALTMLLVVLWAGYMAFAYLTRSVFSPSVLPERYRGPQMTLDVAMLRSDTASARVTPRTPPPPGHYHGVDRWFQPDPNNTCTTAACHQPLPHNRRKETRAFANFHTTFVTCRMCHDKNLSGTARTTWLADKSGEPQDQAPAILRLMTHIELNAERIESHPEAEHAAIVGPLREAVETAGRDPLLEYLLVELETSDPGSPVWRQTLEQLTTELPNHLRGEYGARLDLVVPSGDRRHSNKQMKELTARFVAAAPDSRQRKDLLSRAHEAVLPKPAACEQCHGAKPPRIDYQTMGYPPSRQQMLGSLSTAGMIERIRQGQPFHWPTLLERGPARSTATKTGP